MEIIGNVSILKRHIEDQGIDVRLDKKSLGEEFNLDEYDYIYIGRGTEQNLDVILQDIEKYKNKLEDFIDKEKVVLLTGNSFEILGKSIDEKKALRNF